MKNSSISRRNFLGKAATVGVAGVIVPSIITSCASETKKLLRFLQCLTRHLTDQFSKPVLLVAGVVEQVLQLTF